MVGGHLPIRVSMELDRTQPAAAIRHSPSEFLSVPSLTASQTLKLQDALVVMGGLTGLLFMKRKSSPCLER